MSKNFCTKCNRQCEGHRNPAKHDPVPWTDKDLITNCIKTNGTLRIGGKVSLEDVKMTINVMKSGKSQMDNQVPIKAWKNAPDYALQVLCDAINEYLVDKKPIPPDWEGGVVKFLLEKEPSSEMKNWRPICLLQVSYKIYTSIVT